MKKEPTLSEISEAFEVTSREIRVLLSKMDPTSPYEHPKVRKLARKSVVKTVKDLLKLLGGGPANARHSTETNRWGTPKEWVALACEAQNVTQIEFDPMSEAVFQEVVQAERFLTEQDDCFKHPWLCKSMLINPAGGLVVEAWRYLIQEWLGGRTRQAIWIGFSVEQLNLLAGEELHPDDFCKLSVRKRISFTRHDGYRGSPGHANYVVGVGVNPGVFERVFHDYGRLSFGKMSGARTQSAVVDGAVT